MNAMRGGSAKKTKAPRADDSSEEESDTDGERAADESETDTDTDEE
jgi:translocation protein SEC63